MLRLPNSHSTAPSASPQNVTTIALSSTILQVTWNEVPPVHQNGIIIQYEVEYNQTAFTGATTSATTTVLQVREVNLTGLEEYVSYYVRVRAYTTVGHGPYSEVVMQATQQSGMCSMFYDILLDYNTYAILLDVQFLHLLQRMLVPLAYLQRLFE